MPTPKSNLCLAALMLGGAIASTGCHSRPTEELDPDRPTLRSLDSLQETQAQRGRSSATQAIDFTAEERSRFNRVEQMIQARFSGVQVLPSGGGYTILIRGSSALGTSRSEPLIIIDGASRSTSDLGTISPRDVQRIEIMKDAAASIYGSRGSNGVIRITTIRGNAP
ncbi:MAG: TonB-dependent receptor plug domain-containing protein [Gemmatimonadota bacterium]|nr:TonB-dependent receptor plug domain-containing protein [Gemmatimonadota bacterium]